VLSSRSGIAVVFSIEVSGAPSICQESLTKLSKLTEIAEFLLPVR
jgi:hypothetical protein